VLLWDILCVLVDISTRTPYCSTVCLCLNNSLTHSLSICSGSTSHSGHVLTTRHSLSSVYWLMTAAKASLVRKLPKSSHSASSCR